MLAGLSYTHHLRIAFITRRMVLGYGVDLAVHETASRLVQVGHSVDVWTPNSDGTFNNAPYRIRELIVHGNSHNRALAVYEYNAYKAMRQLSERLRQEQAGYDLLVPCTHPFYGACKAFGVPQVFWNFGNVPHLGFTLKQHLNYAWLDQSEEILHKRRSAAIVSISNFLHEQQPLEYQRKGRVVHLGGDHYCPPSLRTAEARRELRSAIRERCQIPQDAIVLGYCTRLHRKHAEYKGLHEVLALAKRIKALVPRLVLICCGSGSAEDEAWIRSEGAVALANLPPSEMPAFYCALDLYVCPSKWEGFNLPILEAAWLGVPSVAYAVGAHGEHAKGLFVEELSYDELCRATLTLVRDQRLRADFAANALASAQAFTWDSSARQFEQALEAVVH